MVILMNFSPSPLKVEYTLGNHSFFKHLPTNAIVAMDGLTDFSQIANTAFLIGHEDVTIYNQELNVYLNKGAGTPSGTGTTMPFTFIGNNVKSSDEVTFFNASLAAGYAKLKTMFTTGY